MALNFGLQTDGIHHQKSAIVVADGENQIAKFKREHMAPGEMEKIKLPKVLLDKITSGTATVFAQEEE